MRLKKSSVCRVFFVFSTFVLSASTVTLQAADNWLVVVDSDPITSKPVCLMESATHIIDDGQTQTPVKLIYNGKEVYAQTKSNIDVTYPNVGLQIDKKSSISIDRLHKEKTAIFSKQSAEIHRQFIAGRTARLAIGFWPTWPKTDTRIIEFNLIGYTKAFEQYEQCRTNGGVGKQ